MKKYALGSLAIAIAIGAVAFTAPRKANPYWYSATNSVNTLTSVTLSTSQPTQSATDPFGCPGSNNYCSVAFKNFVQTTPGVYQPSDDGTTVVSQSNYPTFQKGTAKKP